MLGLSYRKIFIKVIDSKVVSNEVKVNGKRIDVIPGVWSSSFCGNLKLVKSQEISSSNNLENAAVHVKITDHPTSPKRYLIALKAYERGVRAVFFEWSLKAAYPLKSESFPIPIIHVATPIKNVKTVQINLELYNYYRDACAYRIYLENRDEPMVRLVLYYDRDYEIEFLLCVLYALRSLEDLLRQSIELLLLEASYFGDQSILTHGIMDYECSKTLSPSRIVISLSHEKTTYILSPFNDIERCVKYFFPHYEIRHEYPPDASFEWLLNGLPLIKVNISPVNKELLKHFLLMISFMSVLSPSSVTLDTRYVVDKINSVEQYVIDDELHRLFVKLKDILKRGRQLQFELDLIGMLNRWCLYGTSGQKSKFLAEIDKVRDLYYVKKFVEGVLPINKLIASVGDFKWTSLSKRYALEALMQRHKPLWFKSVINANDMAQGKISISEIKEDLNYMESYITATLENFIEVLNLGEPIEL
mgnify:CR=1 FL=1